MIKLYHVNPETDWIGGTRLAAKVAIALRELDADFEIVYVDRIKDMRDPNSHFRRHLNPLGTVPVIDDDGFILREANTILRYLAERHPGNDIFPSDRRKKAIVDQWMSWEQTSLTPSLLDVYRLACFDDVNKESPANAQDQYQEKLKLPGMKKAQEGWNRNIGILDGELSRYPYVAGTYSLADIAIGCVVPIGAVLGVDLKPFKHVNRWLRELEKRPSWAGERIFTLDVDCGKWAGLIECPEEERKKLHKRAWAPAPF